jgi:hypothetical protein
VGAWLGAAAEGQAVLLSSESVVLGSHWGREGTVEARPETKQQQIPWILLKPEPRKRSCGCDQARVGSCSANNQGATGATRPSMGFPASGRSDKYFWPANDALAAYRPIRLSASCTSPHPAVSTNKKAPSS